MNKSTVQVKDVILPSDLNDIRRLWLEYLVWGNDEMQSLYGVHPHNPQEAVEQDIQSIDKFLPPFGRLMIAIHEGKVCGLGSLKSINEEIGEIKRMYVDPTFRRIGAGRAILERLLLEAKNAGYKKVRLDSPKFMDKAHSLYRSFGFKTLRHILKWKFQRSLKNTYCSWNLIWRHQGHHHNLEALQPTWGLAIAGLDVVIFGCSSLSASFPA